MKKDKVLRLEVQVTANVEKIVLYFLLGMSALFF